jgi:hypothetical protein
MLTGPERVSAQPEEVAGRSSGAERKSPVQRRPRGPLAVDGNRQDSTVVVEASPRSRRASWLRGYLACLVDLNALRTEELHARLRDDPLATAAEAMTRRDRARALGRDAT